MTMDDKRPTAHSRSDMLLSYIKASDRGLYYRQQRDKFLTERLLHAGPWRSIERMHMNKGLRMQWLMTRGDPL